MSSAAGPRRDVFEDTIGDFSFVSTPKAREGSHPRGGFDTGKGSHPRLEPRAPKNCHSPEGDMQCGLSSPLTRSTQIVLPVKSKRNLQPHSYGTLFFVCSIIICFNRSTAINAITILPENWRSFTQYSSYLKRLFKAGSATTNTRPTPNLQLIYQPVMIA